MLKYTDHNKLKNATGSFEESLSGRRCLFYGQTGAKICMIQPMDDHDEEVRENELRLISKELAATPFVHVSVKISDWSNDLSPWKAPAIYKGMAFGDGAPATLVRSPGCSHCGPDMRRMRSAELRPPRRPCGLKAGTAL